MVFASTVFDFIDAFLAAIIHSYVLIIQILKKVRFARRIGENV